MENKKLYICGSDSSKAYRKTYDSIEQLKLENLLWEELGIYELKFSGCISEPSFFNEDDFNMKKIEKIKSSNSNTVRTFFEKASQLFKKKHEVDWADLEGNKQFKWHGKCDGCNKTKDNLTVLYSAALSGVTICRECREGNESNETSKR